MSTTGQIRLGNRPVQLKCPNCHHNVTTQIKIAPGAVTWITCIACVLFGCWCGCCFIPFCIDALQDVEHYCPNCDYYIGRN